MKLEVDRVKKTYRGRGGRSVDAIVGASLSVGPDEIHVVYGPSGCGKSTLLALAGGLLKPDEGRVLWDGAPAGSALLSVERGLRVGVAFQEAPMVNELTVLENLLLPGTFSHMPGLSARAAKLLDRLGLIERAEWRPAELSGGERRRLAVAQALVGRPELIVLDEPTADLDREWASAVLELAIGRAKKLGAGLLIASHDPEVLARASHRHHLAGGKISGEP